MADEPQVSDEQVEATKVDVARAEAVKDVKIASEEPNPLEELRTVRDPLIPQPEPEADPLVPLRYRPSRSRSEENVLHPHEVAETRSGDLETAASPTLDESARLDDHMTREDLDAYAEELGFNPDEFSSKQELLDHVRANPSDKMTRVELDAIARGAGVDEPEALANKDEVIAAIKKAK